MAGVIVPVMPVRFWDFSSIVSAGTSIEIPLKEAIDVSQWLTIGVTLRVMAVDLSGGSIKVQVYFEGPSPEDPGLTFLAPVPPVPPFSPTWVIIDGSLVAPTSISFVVAEFGPSVRINVIGTRTQGAGNISASFGVDLWCRNA